VPTISWFETERLPAVTTHPDPKVGRLKRDCAPGQGAGTTHVKVGQPPTKPQAGLMSCKFHVLGVPFFC
jgi:hypothetical protein